MGPMPRTSATRQPSHSKRACRRSRSVAAAAALALALTACDFGPLLSTPPQASPIPTGTAGLPTLAPSPTTPPPPTPFPIATPTPAGAAPEALTYLSDGRRALFNGDWDRAIANFQNALSTAKDENTAAAALLGMGEARYKSGDPEGASGVFLTFLETYPKAVRVSDAHFWLA